MGFITDIWSTFPAALQLVLVILLKIIAILVSLILAVACTTFAERKVIGYMQGRVGPQGWLQPIVDAVKLLFKEIIIPTRSNRYLFLIAPVLTLVSAFAAWSVIPLAEGMVLADINAGLLFLLVLTSIGVYGVILAGWASNSKYALLEVLRAGAQVMAYKIAMGLALVGVLMAAGTLNLNGIVLAQSGSLFSWFVWPLFGLFFVYLITGMVATNRASFDVAGGGSELVAGVHVEYSGMAFALFLLAEYVNILLISVLTALMFLGGWLSPFQGLDFLTGLPVLGWVFGHGIHWLLLKTALFLFCYLWFRATFPRYRDDQLMQLGWKVLIPVTIVWIFAEMVAIALGWTPWA